MKRSISTVAHTRVEVSICNISIRIEKVSMYRFTDEKMDVQATQVVEKPSQFRHEGSNTICGRFPHRGAVTQCNTNKQVSNSP